MAEHEEEAEGERQGASRPQLGRPKRGYTSRPTFKPPQTQGSLLPAGLAVALAAAIALVFGAANLIGPRQASPVSAPQVQQVSRQAGPLSRLLEAARSRPARQEPSIAPRVGPAELPSDPVRPDLAQMIRAPAVPPEESLAEQAPAASRDAPGGYYINGGYIHGGGPEPEQRQSGVIAFLDFNNAAHDGYPIVGDHMDAIVDGKPARLPLQPAVAHPGWTKAAVVLPDDGRPHTVTFIEVYDLGAGGIVQVRNTEQNDGRGNRVTTYETPVQTLVIHSWEGVKRLKVKD